MSEATSEPSPPLAPAIKAMEFILLDPKMPFAGSDTIKAFKRRRTTNTLLSENNFFILIQSYFLIDVYPRLFIAYNLNLTNFLKNRKIGYRTLTNTLHVYNTLHANTPPQAGLYKLYIPSLFISLSNTGLKSGLVRISAVCSVE